MKVGLIVDSLSASNYVYELATRANATQGLSVSHLIVQETPVGSGGFVQAVRRIRQRGVLYSFRRAGFVALTFFERSLLRRTPSVARHFSRVRLDKAVPNVLRITPQISKSGFVYRYADADLQAVRALGLDVLIRCGAGILRGGILHAARFGIISLHHGDNRVNRGGPPAFWEVLLRKPDTGFTIQQLSEELDGGGVLFRGSIATRSSLLLNQVAVYEKSYLHLGRLLARIAVDDALPGFEDPNPYCEPLFRLPTLTQQCRYSLRTALIVLGKAFDRHVLRRAFRWGVAFAPTGWRTLVMWQATIIRNPPCHFLADPFVVEEKGLTCCFVEDYDFKKRRGCITAYELRDTAYERIGEVIAEPFHLSFPFVFRFGEKLYMCPESAQNGDIRIYECTRFPSQWRLQGVAMSGVSAADTMIFEHAGKWWLCTNIDPGGAGSDRSELHIFHAQEPLGGAWRAHAKNPVFVDSARARNGGLLREGGSIFRVSQRAAFGVYGRSASIRRIDVLTEYDYSETEVARIEPNFRRGIRGTHHMHSNGPYTVFDFVERAGIGR